MKKDRATVPFKFDFHSSEVSPGHHFVFGSTGGGLSSSSIFLQLLLAQSGKGKVFAFDKDSSLPASMIKGARLAKKLNRLRRYGAHRTKVALRRSRALPLSSQLSILNWMRASRRKPHFFMFGRSAQQLLEETKPVPNALPYVETMNRILFMAFADLILAGELPRLIEEEVERLGIDKRAVLVLLKARVKEEQTPPAGFDEYWEMMKQ